MPQDLPPAERKENAKVNVIASPLPEPKAVEQTHGHADLSSPDPLYGRSAIIDSPTIRDGFPAWTTKMDIRKAGEQMFLRGYLPADKGYVYFVPDKFLRRGANGEFLTGVDDSKMPESNTIYTNSANYRPWGDKLTDRAEDLGLALLIVGICGAVAMGIKRWRGR